MTPVVRRPKMTDCGIPAAEQTAGMAGKKRDAGARPGYGKRIVEAYTRASLNRHQFSQALGTTYANVIRWEKEDSVPGGHYLAAIASICKVSEAWILRGDDVQESREFREWLAAHAPADLRDDERAALAQIALPGAHPGPLFYSAVLTAWRMGSTRRDPNTPAVH